PSPRSLYNSTARRFDLAVVAAPPPPPLRPLATATALFWIQPATALAAYCHYFHSHRDAFLAAAAGSEVRLSGLVLLYALDLPSFFAITGGDDPFTIVLPEFRELVDVGRSSASRSQQESRFYFSCCWCSKYSGVFSRRRYLQSIVELVKVFMLVNGLRTWQMMMSLLLFTWTN
ncbi:unnamed protein product, partial [Urochloa humidicola]